MINLNDVPKKYVLIGLIMIMVFVILGYSNSKIRTLNASVVTTVSDVKSQIQTVNAQIDKVNTKINRLSDFKNKFPKLDIEQARFESLIYINSLIDEFKILSVETTPDVESIDGIAQVPIKIKVSGDFIKIKDLMKRVQNREKNIFIKDIEVELTEENELNSQLSIVALASEKPNFKKTTVLSDIGKVSPFGVFVNFSSKRQELEDLQKELINGGGTIPEGSSNVEIPSVEEETPEPDFFPLENKSKELQINKNGIRLSVDERADVIAVESGVVIFSGQLANSGNTVMIRNHEGNIAIYSDLSSIYVSKGQNIRKHGVIGVAGVYFKYMNFNYTVNGRSVDVKKYLDDFMFIS